MGCSRCSILPAATVVIKRSESISQPAGVEQSTINYQKCWACPIKKKKSFVVTVNSFCLEVQKHFPQLLEHLCMYADYTWFMNKKMSSLMIPTCRSTIWNTSFLHFNRVWSNHIIFMSVANDKLSDSMLLQHTVCLYILSKNDILSKRGSALASLVLNIHAREKEVVFGSYLTKLNIFVC